MNTLTTLRFADGEVLELHNVSPEATIFEQAKAAGVSLAHDCLNGTCGTCKCRILQGAVKYNIDRSHLALVEGSNDEVLVCQARTTSGSLELSLPYTRASVLPERKRKLNLTGLQKVCDSVWEIRCKSEGPRMFPFMAGQYVRLAPVGSGFERLYSPASVSGAGEVHFLIRELEGGRMTSYLRDIAKVGDIWQVTGPYGIFYRRHIEAPALYVAGGTGLSPILSMLREQQSRLELSAPMTLVFGVTREQDLFYVDEIEQLQKAIPRLQVRICVMTGSTLPGATAGTVVDALTSEDIKALGKNGRVYLCGPPAMLAAVRSKLSAMDLSPDQVFAEEFLPTKE